MQGDAGMEERLKQSLLDRGDFLRSLVKMKKNVMTLEMKWLRNVCGLRFSNRVREYRDW